VSDWTATLLLERVMLMNELARTEVDEFDTPLGGIDGLSRLQLERTHMEVAVAEVRFLPTVESESLPEDVAVAVWKGLGQTLFPVFERHSMNNFSLMVTPNGADSSMRAQHGWVLATADRRSSITLLPAMVVVQTSNYERFSVSLGQPLKDALRLFAKETGVSLIQRIGLRYINRLQDPQASSPLFWNDQVRPEFAGPLLGTLAPLVEGLHQQVQLRLAPTAVARVQSGVFREQGSEERYSFLVDLDVFREEALPFDEILCANLTRQLNRTALALFCQMLSDRYLAELGPVEISEVKS
jgi:uncharacterized protein (TIGR04255 family)